MRVEDLNIGDKLYYIDDDDKVQILTIKSISDEVYVSPHDDIDYKIIETEEGQTFSTLYNPQIYPDKESALNALNYKISCLEENYYKIREKINLINNEILRLSITCVW